MVGVAQLVERWIVVPVAEGSNPSTHPKLLTLFFAECNRGQVIGKSSGVLGIHIGQHDDEDVRQQNAGWSPSPRIRHCPAHTCAPLSSSEDSLEYVTQNLRISDTGRAA